MGSPQSYLILIIPIAAASAAQIFLKKGMMALGRLDFTMANLVTLIPKILQNIWLVSGALLFGVSFLLYLFTLSKFQLGIIYPIFVSAGVIIVSLASSFLFKEAFSWPQVAGIAAIILGIFLLSTKS